MEELYKNSPVDHEFWFNTHDQMKSPNNLKLPEAKDDLIVSKPIGKYKPIKKVVPSDFQPDITRIYSRKYPHKSKNMKVRIQIKLPLTGE